METNFQQNYNENTMDITSLHLNNFKSYSSIIQSGKTFLLIPSSKKSTRVISFAKIKLNKHYVIAIYTNKTETINSLG